MEDYTFGDLINSAKEAGGTSDAPPAGNYQGAVVSANTGKSNSGKLKIGLKLRVEGGAHDGAGIWSNQYLSPESPAAVDIFFRTFEALGIPRNWWAQFGSNLDAAGAAVVDFVKGAKCSFTVKQGSYNGNPQMEVSRISKPSGVAAPGAVQAPAAPAAVAAPAAPVPPAPPVPPAAPTVQAPQPPF